MKKLTILLLLTAALSACKEDKGSPSSSANAALPLAVELDAPARTRAVQYEDKQEVHYPFTVKPPFTEPLRASVQGPGRVTLNGTTGNYVTTEPGAAVVEIRDAGGRVATVKLETASYRVDISTADGKVAECEPYTIKIRGSFPPYMMDGQALEGVERRGRVFGERLSFKDAKGNEVYFGVPAAERFRDLCFGSAGRVDFNDGLEMTAIDANEFIVVAGHAGSTLSVLRFNDKGQLDRAFGSDGRLTFDALARGVQSWRADRLVVDKKVGYISGLATMENGRQTLFTAKFDGDGRLDAQFGVALAGDFDAGSARVERLLLGPKGVYRLLITVAGRKHLFAFDRDGKPDPQAGPTGEYVNPHAEWEVADVDANVYTGGLLVLERQGENGFRLISLGPDFTPNETFGDHGQLSLAWSEKNPADNVPNHIARTGPGNVFLYGGNADKDTLWNLEFHKDLRDSWRRWDYPSVKGRRITAQLFKPGLAKEPVLTAVTDESGRSFLGRGTSPDEEPIAEPGEHIVALAAPWGHRWLVLTKNRLYAYKRATSVPAPDKR